MADPPAGTSTVDGLSATRGPVAGLCSARGTEVGTTSALRLTLPANPAWLVMLIVELPVCPARTVMVEGFEAIAKNGPVRSVACIQSKLSSVFHAPVVAMPVRLVLLGVASCSV